MSYANDTALKAAIRALSPSLSFRKTEAGEYRISVQTAFFENNGQSYPEARERAEAIAAYVDCGDWMSKAEKIEAREEAYQTALMTARNVIWLR